MKKIFSLSLVLFLALTFCCKTANALENSTYASLTLTGYSARLSKGETAGKVNISYDVRSSKMADSLGVLSITVYQSNGNCVKTINGSTDNGLICEDRPLHMGTYSCELDSGVSYYVEVTVFATVGNTSDQRVITSQTITAP